MTTNLNSTVYKEPNLHSLQGSLKQTLILSVSIGVLAISILAFSTLFG